MDYFVYTWSKTLQCIITLHTKPKYIHTSQGVDFREAETEADG